MSEYYQYLDTDIGIVQVRANESAVTAIGFVDSVSPKEHKNSVTSLACTQLLEYFQGQRKTFDLPLAPQGTEFQQQVWQCLLTVPHGQTTSYGDIARRLNNPNAVRAVGAANGRNPIAIVIPCHRIIGTNGTLTGYAGGLDRKARLLDLENPQASFL